MERCIDHFTLPENPVLDKDRADGQCGDDLYWKLVNNTLHIFGTGELYPWAWKDCFPEIFNEVRIQPGCTKIGDHAFDPVFAYRRKWDRNDRTVKIILHPIYGSWKLESRLERVFLPDTVTEIGQFAFCRCKELDTVNLDCVEKIGDKAFAHSGLRNPCISGKNKEIGKDIFLGCQRMHSLTVGMKIIEEDAFSCLHQISQLTLCEGVETIGANAFKECGVVTVRFPGTVKEIGIGAFLDCSCLKEIYIPCSVQKIGDSAFANCNSLSGDYGKIVIEKGVEKIGAWAFDGDHRDIHIEIPDSVKEIGEDAFQGIGAITYYGPAHAENMWGAWELNGLKRPLTWYDTHPQSEWIVADDTEEFMEGMEDLEPPEFDL